MILFIVFHKSSTQAVSQVAEASSMVALYCFANCMDSLARRGDVNQMLSSSPSSQGHPALSVLCRPPSSSTSASSLPCGLCWGGSLLCCTGFSATAVEAFAVGASAASVAVGSTLRALGPLATFRSTRIKLYLSQCTFALGESPFLRVASQSIRPTKMILFGEVP